MIKQFLLNQDGTIPEGTNVALLEANGIPLVRPVIPPIQSGKIAVEQEPVVDNEGVYWQSWRLEDVEQTVEEKDPSQEEPDLVNALMTLSPEQKKRLLAFIMGV